MSMLFPIEVLPSDIPAIPGLSYHPEYVTAERERRLVAAIDSGPWDTSWDRRRQHFGASYGSHGDSAAPIPEWGLDLIDQFDREGISNLPFNQMLVNEYLPGQGIAMHRDYEPFDRTVVSLSLLAPCVMDFRYPGTTRRETLLLQRRSLLVLSDAARYEWQHGIARRKNDRWHELTIPRVRRLSVTFRRRKEN